MIFLDCKNFFLLSKVSHKDKLSSDDVTTWFITAQLHWSTTDDPAGFGSLCNIQTVEVVTTHTGRSGAVRYNNTLTTQRTNTPRWSEQYEP